MTEEQYQRLLALIYEIWKLRAELTNQGAKDFLVLATDAIDYALAAHNREAE